MSTFRFGQPWHGQISPAGLLLENATLRTEWPAIPPYPHFTYYTDFDMPAAPASNSVEAAAGMVWKKDIVFSGRGKYYHPSGLLAIGEDSWVYKCSDGTVYKLSVYYSSSTGAGQVAAVKLGGVSPTTIASFTANATPNTTAQQFIDVNASPRGDKAILNVGRTISSYTSAMVAYSRVNYVYAMVEFVISGGSASALPSCTTETLFTSTTYINTTTWENPDNHSITSPNMDYLAESTTTRIQAVAGGYNRSGERQVITTRNHVHQNNTKVGPATNDYLDTSLLTSDNQVQINGVTVYSAPQLLRLRVRQFTPPSTVTIIEDISENMHYLAEVMQLRYLSNCLFGFGMAHATETAWEMLHIRSFFGAATSGLVGALFGGSDVDTVTVAAFDPRTETVLSGIGKGFI